MHDPEQMARHRRPSLVTPEEAYFDLTYSPLRDGPDRARSEQQLRKSEERLRSAAEVARFAPWDWNVRTGQVTWSEEHCRMTGYAVGEVAPSYEARAARLHPDDRADTERAVSGPAVELPGDSVQAVALALHELATNAVKYGAIAQAAGRLAVTWHVEAGGRVGDGGGSRRLVIDWRESGVAMPDGPPARRGYGTELITRALPYQLRAETALEFTPGGVRCRITLPARAFNDGPPEERT